MAKIIYWTLIFATLALNVIMLQWTVEAYLGLEFNLVYRYSAIAIISSMVTLGTFFLWRKKQYS